MNAQHLSDEAVAAFADGVLRGHARERATRHTAVCAECDHAVREQREAAWALRAAPAPSLPLGLMDRLRTVPHTTPISTLPTAIGPDGSTMLATFAPMAALVPVTPDRPPLGSGTAPAEGPPAPAESRSFLRSRPIITTAAVMALTGALTAGSVAHQVAGPAAPGSGQVVHSVPGVGGAPIVTNVNLFRAVGP